MRKRIVLVVFLAISCLYATAGVPKPKTPTKIYTCGNSYTNSTFNTGLEALCESAGHEIADLKTAGVAGASLTIVLKADRKDIETHLGGEYWDVVTLQSYYGNLKSETEAAIEIVRIGRQKNPNIRVIMFTIWPPYSVRYDPPAGRKQSWNELIAKALKKKYPDNVVQVIPVAEYFKELYERIDAGKVPNLKSHNLLWRDGGHPGKFGAYPINAMTTAMIFDESPIGYSNISVEGQSIPKETAAVMQRLAQDVLNTYQPALMNEEPTISTLRLKTAVQGLDFEQQLECINASGNQTWKVADGALPNGLTLTESGAIKGAASATGEFPVTLRLKDGETSSDRSYNMKVEPDLPPQIVTGKLPTVEHAKYFIETLKAENGVGTLSWKLVDGKLPAGVQVLPSGFLVGTPGEHGSFTFIIGVADSHPKGAKTHEKEMTLTVSDPDADTLFIREYAAYTAPLMDGSFEEPYWNFDRSETYTLSKAVQGSPTATVEWDAFWWHGPQRDKAKLFVGVRVKVGELGKTKLDSVDIFFDGNNNDEVIYNYDDAHWRFTRIGNRHNGGHLPIIVAGYMRFFNSSIGVQETEDGWQMEAEFDGNALGGRGIITAWPDWAVYGFDIAVRQGDDGQIHQQVWHGSIRNPEDTSPFGAIVFKPTNSQPHHLPRILNGDFSKKDYATFNIIGGMNFPKHEWIRQTKNNGGPAWKFVRGKGMIHNNPQSTVTGLMQVIDTPKAGTYALRFGYKAPKVGFRVGVWSSEPGRRGNMGVDSLTVQGQGAQHLQPKAVPATGDGEWHTAEIPVAISGDAKGDMFIVFAVDKPGDTGVMIGNVSLELLK